MKITPVTLIFVFCSLIAIYYTIGRLKKDTIGIRSAVIWFLLWLFIGFFSLFPNLLNAVMRIAQMENRMFFILITAVFILFALAFNLSSRIDHLQRNISRLIQEIAILNQKNDEIQEHRNPRSKKVKTEK